MSILQTLQACTNYSGELTKINFGIVNTNPKKNEDKDKTLREKQEKRE